MACFAFSYQVLFCIPKLLGTISFCGGATLRKCNASGNPAAKAQPMKKSLDSRLSMLFYFHHNSVSCSLPAILLKEGLGCCESSVCSLILLSLREVNGHSVQPLFWDAPSPFGRTPVSTRTPMTREQNKSQSAPTSQPCELILLLIGRQRKERLRTGNSRSFW